VYLRIEFIRTVCFKDIYNICGGRRKKRVGFRGIGGTMLLLHGLWWGPPLVNEVVAFWRRRNGSRNLGK